MKTALLVLFIATSIGASAQQSLKEALFSGRLKNQPGTVIRRGDDLTAKMDTGTRKPAADEMVSTANITAMQPVATTTLPPATAAANPEKKIADTTQAAEVVTPAMEVAAAPAEPTESDPAAAAKENNAVIKDYMNTLAATLKSEVISSKKVKKESYAVMVTYAIGTDGQVAFKNVFVSPENLYLQQQIQERLSLEAPKLSPVLNDAGQPRKVNKRYNFVITKE